MADNILRLKVESSEYDAKLANAAKGIRHLADVAHTSAGDLTGLEKSELDYIRALGEMETKSRSASGQLRELSSTYKELKVIYDQLNEVEKADEGGKALAASLETLKQRAQEAKSQLDTATQSLNDNSKEADANIKHTGQVLADYFRKVREGDGTFAMLDEGVMEAIKAIREMGTKADSTRGALRELTQVTTDLTAAYRSLDDTALQSDTGKELSKTIEILTQRAGEAKDAMGDVSAAITSSASDTRGFDQIAGGISLMTSGFQTAVGAANLFGLEIGNQEKVLATLASAMSITNGLQTVQNLLQSQSALMMGVQAVQAKALAASQALVGKHTAVATAAQAAFNVVAKANPYVLLATAVVGVGAALIAFTGKSKEAAKANKEQEEAMKRAENATKTYASTLSNSFAESMTKYNQLKASYEALKTSHEKTEWIKNNATAFRDLGIKVTDVKSAEDVFYNNTQQVVDGFKRRAEAAAIAAKMTELYRQQMDLKQRASDRLDKVQVQAYDRVPESITNQGMTRDRGADTFNGGKYGLNSQGQFYFLTKGADEYNRKLWESDAQLKGMNEEWKSIGLRIDQATTRMTELAATTPTTTIDFLGFDNPEEKDPKKIAPVGSVADLNKQMQELQKEQQLVTSYAGWQEYQQQIEAVSDRISLLKGELPKDKEAVFTVTAETSEALEKLRGIDGVKIDPKGVTVTAETSEALRSVQKLIGGLDGTTVHLKVKAVPQEMAIGTSIQNSAGLSSYISDLQKQLSTADFGTSLYNNLQAQLADTTTLQNLVGEALKVGLGTALFDVADEMGADFWTRAMEGGVANIDWQAIIDQINEARKEAGLDAISLDFASGNVSKDKKKDSLQDSKTVLNAISQLTSGLESIGIEIPSEIQSVISVMQGVIQVIEAVNAIIGVTQTTALTANTIAMTSLTTALWANTATSLIPCLAGGGIVPRFAGGGLIGNAALGMTIPGHSYSGDLLRLPVDGGRGMIGVNSGEIIMNQAQAGILESELSGGRMRDINVHGVLQGENIVLAVSNYFRRTGKGEAAMWGKN